MGGSPCEHPVLPTSSLNSTTLISVSRLQPQEALTHTMRNEKKNISAKGGEKQILDGLLRVLVKTLEPDSLGVCESFPATYSPGSAVPTLNCPSSVGPVTPRNEVRMKAH